MITAEYGVREIEIAPSVVDLGAEMLQIDQQPFGRARSTLKGIRLLKSGVVDIIRLFKHTSDDDPGWLQPPDRASYPMIPAGDRYTSVELDALAHDWLERVRPSETKKFVFRAAGLFDEDPVVKGRLTSGDGTGPVALEIPLPEHHATIAAT